MIHPVLKKGCKVMQKLLPPLLKCKPSPCKAIWSSKVIPACKVRPLAKTDSFLGYQLMVFAKKTKKHVVFDAQIDLDIFCRTGNFSCVRTCEDSDRQIICSGRLNLKDNFLKGNREDRDSVDVLSLLFYENGICEAIPGFMTGKQVDFQIQAYIARGHDFCKKALDCFNIQYFFNECGKSLLKFVQEQTKNV